MAKLYLPLNYYHLQTNVITRFFGFLLAIFCMAGCLPSKKIYFLNGLENNVQKIDSIKGLAVQKIQRGDKLSVIVSCPDPSKTSFLNPFSNQNAGNATQSSSGFLVDSSGCIDFPMIGKTQLAGLTSKECAELLKDKLRKYFLDPYVYVSLTGKAFIINGRGGYSVNITNERLTILEALAQQGSYEPDDKWDEVLVIREENGNRTSEYIDITSKELLNSPYYYLHSNDLVYIKPGKVNAILKNTTAVRSTLGLITGFLTLFILLLKK